MATQKQTLVGGSFAPPLSDELLAQYDVLVSALDSREQTTDIITQLLACVRAWWNEPDSTGGGKPHPVLGRAVAVIDLDGDIAARLWEAIPWREELEAWKPLLEPLEYAANKRNEAKLVNWRQAVRLSLYGTLTPGLNADSLEACYRLHKATKKLCAPMGEKLATAAASAASGALFPGWSGEEVLTKVDTVASAWIAAVKGVSSRLKELAVPETAVPPKPALEPTPVRDMAHSLLWHAVELERDREPLTADKIGA